MKRECTELFVHYREIVRLVWNLGFCSSPSLRDWAAVDIYRDAMAKLFEGMILLALGYRGRIRDDDTPGEIADFQVTVKMGEPRLHVDKHRPDEHVHVWGVPVVRLSSGSKPYRLKFVRFFDWNLLAARDFRFLEVLIERLDDQPELVGRHGLIEPEGCSIWFILDDDPQAQKAPQPSA
jgi:hypothetical protein